MMGRASADLFAIRPDGTGVRQITRSLVWDSAPDLGAAVAAIPNMNDVVDELATARIGNTFNQYAAGARAPLLRARLACVPFLRAPRRRSCSSRRRRIPRRAVSGLPFTSERQLTGDGPAEATATIVQRALASSGSATRCCCGTSSRRTRARDEQSRAHPTRGPARARFAERLAAERRVIAVGRVAAGALEATYVRHPFYRGRRGVRAGPSRRVPGRRSKPSEAATLRRRRSSTAAFPSDDHLHRQAGRDPARLVRRGRRGEDPGRLATQIADTLRGKGKPGYTPHVDTGDFVIVVNAEKFTSRGRSSTRRWCGGTRPTGRAQGADAPRAARAAPDGGHPQGCEGHSSEGQARLRADPQAQGLRGAGAPARSPVTEDARGLGTVRQTSPSTVAPASARPRSRA